MVLSHTGSFNKKVAWDCRNSVINCDLIIAANRARLTSDRDVRKKQLNALIQKFLMSVLRIPKAIYELVEDVHRRKKFI